MATITLREIIQEILDNDGVYPGDPQATSVYEYRNVFDGEVAWAVFWNERHFDLDRSPAVYDYVLLWKRGHGQRAPIGVLEEECRTW